MIADAPEPAAAWLLTLRLIGYAVRCIGISSSDLVGYGGKFGGFGLLQLSSVWAAGWLLLLCQLGRVMAGLVWPLIAHELRGLLRVSVILWGKVRL